MAMKTSSKMVLNYLKENANADLTAADVAAALGLTDKQVNGAFTSAIQRKELGYREACEVETADNKHKEVKFLRLNEAGLSFNPDSESDAE